MTTALVYDPALTGYRFPAGHPLRPERFSLTVDLIRAWGLVTEDTPSLSAEDDVACGHGDVVLIQPRPASQSDLLLVHDADYVSHVRTVSEHPELADLSYGIGPGDTPAFPGMHELSALVVGASITALEAVVSDGCKRSFSPAGGLHHAKRDRASGFCVYNDCAIAIEYATRTHPGLRVAYVDLDAHHGDGVEAAFIDRSDVLTLSVHESGRYLFPGTGFERDIGTGRGEGYALNIPLPPYAGEAEYVRVVDEVIGPALHAFAPDVIFAQLGGDTHRDDPLTQLDQTVHGYVQAVGRLIPIADEVCGGRIVATGGGGYESFFAVPRMWASAFALLLGAPVPEDLPGEWLSEAVQAAGIARAPVSRTFDERDSEPLDPGTRESAELLTERAILAATEASPLLRR